MAQYKTITNPANNLSVSVTNGDATVTSDGSTNTDFVTEVSAGDIFTIVGDNAWYEVASITSATVLELTTTYSGATGSSKSFVISRDFTDRLGLPYPQKGDIETASLIKRAFAQIDVQANVAKSEFAATAAPTVNDDADDGYAVGSQWVNTTSDEAYLCVDSTAGAAVWFLLSGELYHQGSKKLEATADGVTITGDLTITGEIDGGTF